MCVMFPFCVSAFETVTVPNTQMDMSKKAKAYRVIMKNSI